MKYSSYSVVERIGTRSPGSVLSPTVRIDEAAPRSRQTARRAGQQSGGDFCYYVDTQGRQHFNFVQRIWLRASVGMAVTPVMTIALETLAINLLTHLIRERDYPVAVGVTSRRVLKLARRFCTECLLTAQADGWVMPRSTLRAWLASRAGTQRRVRR